jgi:hypothetical protein
LGENGEASIEGRRTERVCATGTSYDGVVVEGSRWMWDRMQSCGLAGGGRRGGAGAGAGAGAEVRRSGVCCCQQEASKQAGVAGDGCGCSVLAVPSTAGNGHSRRVGQWGRVVVVGSWPSLGAGEDGQTCNDAEYAAHSQPRVFFRQAQRSTATARPAPFHPHPPTHSARERHDSIPLSPSHHIASSHHRPTVPAPPALPCRALFSPQP